MLKTFLSLMFILLSAFPAAASNPKPYNLDTLIERASDVVEVQVRTARFADEMNCKDGQSHYVVQMQRVLRGGAAPSSFCTNIGLMVGKTYLLFFVTDGDQWGVERSSARTLVLELEETNSFIDYKKRWLLTDTLLRSVSSQIQVHHERVSSCLKETAGADKGSPECPVIQARELYLYQDIVDAVAAYSAGVTPMSNSNAALLEGARLCTNTYQELGPNDQRLEMVDGILAFREGNKLELYFFSGSGRTLDSLEEDFRPILNCAVVVNDGLKVTFLGSGIFGTEPMLHDPANIEIDYSFEGGEDVIAFLYRKEAGGYTLLETKPYLDTTFGDAVTPK